MPVDKEQILTLSDRVSALSEDILRREYPSPEMIKQSPLFTVSETAKMLDISRTTLSTLLKDESIEREMTYKAVVDDNGNEEQKALPPKFTLSQIQAIRDHLKANGLKGNYTNRRPENVDWPFMVTFYNLKGGIGKSTLALAFAQYASSLGYRVLLVDGDPQASVTSLAGFLPYDHPDIPDGAFIVKEENTLMPLYAERHPLRPTPTYWENLSIIPSSVDLYSAEFSLAGRQMHGNGNYFEQLEYGLTTRIENWESDQDAPAFDTHDEEGNEIQYYNPDDWDIIVTDTSPSFSFASQNILFATDGLVVPTPPMTLDILSTGSFFTQMFKMFDEVEEIFGVKKEFDFLYGVKTKMSNSEENLNNGGNISAVYQDMLLNSSIHMNKAVTIASDMNKTIYEIQNSGGLSKATLKKAKENFDQLNEEILLKIKEHWSNQ